VIYLKDYELTYSIRPLDTDGVADTSSLETTDLREALLKLRTLSNDPLNKWVIVAVSDDDQE